MPRALFPEFPAPKETRAREPDYQSGYHPEPPPETSPPRPKAKKSRFSERQQRLRALDVPSYARDQYLADRALSSSTRGLVGDMLGHLSRCKGGMAVKGLTSDLLHDFRDYFLGLIADGEISPATANKHLRQLRAVANHAAADRLVKRIDFKKMFRVDDPNPQVWSADEYRRIEEASQKVTGSVGMVPAGVWWFAWWRTISRAGCRLSAMMLAARGDYRNGVLWLRADNQKQHEDQRIALPARSCLAIEELLAVHSEPKLFPWPHDPVKEGQKTNWKTLFAHFQRFLLNPCEISLPRGVKTRMCRRTAATIVKELGGSGQKLCGHKSETTTNTHYIPRDRVPITRDALLIPETDAAVQLNLFQKGDS